MTVDFDGGTGDRHRVLLDEDGVLWGWENLTPRDPRAIQAAMLSGAAQWNHYRMTALTTHRRTR